MLMLAPRCLFVLALSSATTAHASARSSSDSVQLYFGNGCFFARQYLFVTDFERKALGRSDEELTAIQGYAGSKNLGPNGTACYHNKANFSDYDSLGLAEVVEVDVPTASLDDVFATYFGSFIELDKGIWERPDYYDQGAQYRSLVGIPGGLNNKPALEAMQKANIHNLTLKAGQGSDDDTFTKNTVFVMDSTQFPFTQAELCLQFHDDSQATYPESYHKLLKGYEARGRLQTTKCPGNVICGSASTLSGSGLAVIV